MYTTIFTCATDDFRNLDFFPFFLKMHKNLPNIKFQMFGEFLRDLFFKFKGAYNMNNYYCCCISSSSLTIELSTVVEYETRRCLCGLSFASLSISHTLLTFLEWYGTYLTYYKSMRLCGVPQRQENENSHCLLYGSDHEILILAHGRQITI